jgi:hypothetical protein
MAAFFVPEGKIIRGQYAVWRNAETFTHMEGLNLPLIR